MSAETAGDVAGLLATFGEWLDYRGRRIRAVVLDPTVEVPFGDGVIPSADTHALVGLLDALELPDGALVHRRGVDNGVYRISHRGDPDGTGGVVQLTLDRVTV